MGLFDSALIMIGRLFCNEAPQNKCDLWVLFTHLFSRFFFFFFFILKTVSTSQSNTTQAKTQYRRIYNIGLQESSHGYQNKHF